MPTWINRSKNLFTIIPNDNYTLDSDEKHNIRLLNAEQRKAFEIVHSHFTSSSNSFVLSPS